MNPEKLKQIEKLRQLQAQVRIGGKVVDLQFASDSALSKTKCFNFLNMIKWQLFTFCHG